MTCETQVESGKELAAFLLALAVILIAFSQMFYTLFRQTEHCEFGENADYYTEFPVRSMDCGTNDATNELECTTGVDCEPINTDPFCNFRTSFFKVFTMLLGEVDEVYFRNDSLATFLYALFMFAVVYSLDEVSTEMNIEVDCFFLTCSALLSSHKILQVKVDAYT